MKYILFNSFSGSKISTHLTVEAAVEASVQHLAKVKKVNGASSYLTYKIEAADGSDISAEIESVTESLGW
jgi:hypothetical protein